MSGSDAAMNIVLGAQDATGPGVASAEGNVSRLKGTVSGLMAAWGAVGGVVATAAGFLSDAAQAAAADQASVDRLKKAVENSGVSWSANQKAVEDRIKAGQDLAFSDDQTRDSLALLVAQTGSLDEALKREQLAMDIARGAGVDLGTASKLLGKVTDENVAVFARMGIQVDKNMTQEQVFAALRAKFAGQAAAHAASGQGQIEIWKDRINEWKESLGAALGPAQVYVALLPGLSAGFSAAGAAAGVLTAQTTLLGDRSILTVAKMGIVRAATLAWTAVQWLLNVALSANPIGLVVAAIAALAAGFVWAYKNVGWFHAAVDKVFPALKAFGEWVWNNLKPILEWLGQRVMEIAGFMGNIISGAQGLARAAHDLHVPGFAWGGTVPGNLGEPRLVLAHGGEEVRTAGEARFFADRATPVAPVVNNYITLSVGPGVYAEGPALDNLANKLAQRLSYATGR